MKTNIKRKLFASQSKCRICGSTSELQIDHIYPLSKGGSNVLGNLQVLCAKCNLKKSNKFQSRFSHAEEVKSW